eukprot:12150063-Alexandrium_andersonii.AAC.1
MSASLVGSEMCIRDSCWWPQPRAVRVSRANAAWRSRRCRCGEWVAELAVSYTHLTLPTICSV